jgi:hypothetical protein
MKLKSLLSFIILISLTGSVFSIPKDFIDINPIEFIKDSSNIFSGDTVSNQEEFSFQNSFIICSTIAKVNAPFTIFQYFQSKNQEQSILYSLYSNYIQMYLDKAFLVSLEYLNNLNIIEERYKISIKGYREIIIYAHYSELGFQGFGFSYSVYSNILKHDKTAIFNSIYYNPNKWQEVNKLSKVNIRNGFSYFLPIKLDSKIILHPTKDCLDEYGFGSCIEQIIIRSTKTTYGQYKVKISLNMSDVKLKNDVNFLCSYLKMASGEVITYGRLITNKDGIILNSASPYIAILNYLTVDLEKMDSFLDKFDLIIEILE